MSVSEIVNVAANLLVIIAVLYMFAFRKGIDERIQQLSKTLSSVSDLINKNFSWRRTAEEMEAMQQILDKRFAEELKNKDDAHLKTAKKMKLEQLEHEYNFRILWLTVDEFMPFEHKAAAIAYLKAAKDQGYLTNDRVLEVYSRMIEKNLAESAESKAGDAEETDQAPYAPKNKE